MAREVRQRGLHQAAQLDVMQIFEQGGPDRAAVQPAQQRHAVLDVVGQTAQQRVSALRRAVATLGRGGQQAQALPGPVAHVDSAHGILDKGCQRLPAVGITQQIGGVAVLQRLLQAQRQCVAPGARVVVIAVPRLQLHPG